MITVYAFGSLPPPAIGLSRDLRVLWALEESGLPYRVHALDAMHGDLGSAEYAKVNPFSLVPSIDDDGFKLFESAAILFYIAEKSGKLLPTDAKGRALATQWAFAALDTVEPSITNLAVIDAFYADEAWAKERRPTLVETAKKRLATLERELPERPFLTGNDFSAPDILMTTVLRQIQHTDILSATPNVSAYKARCEDRPAWKKVYAAYEQRLAA